MVGLLGCGCCSNAPGRCCSGPTETWIDPFEQTPVGRKPYDITTNMSIKGARSDCPAPIALPASGIQYHKTSTLQINADDESPLYLGLNGFPFGGKFTAGWLSSSNASQWTLILPVFSGQTWMGIDIATELIFEFESVTYYSGSSYQFYKRATQLASGQIYYEYGTQMAGYRRIGSGSNLTQTTVIGGTFASPRYLDWDVQNLYELDEGSETCQQFKETKQGRNNAGSSPITFRNLRTAGPVNSDSIPQQKFQCFVGWKSTVTWWTWTPLPVSGGGLFDFKSEYVSWKPAAWTSYMP